MAKHRNYRRVWIKEYTKKIVKNYDFAVFSKGIRVKSHWRNIKIKSFREDV